MKWKKPAVVDVLCVTAAKSVVLPLPVKWRCWRQRPAKFTAAPQRHRHLRQQLHALHTIHLSGIDRDRVENWQRLPLRPVCVCVKYIQLYISLSEECSSHLDCQRRPLFHTLPKEGSQLASVCELWSKLAPTLFGGSFFSFSCSSGKRQMRPF